MKKRLFKALIPLLAVPGIVWAGPLADRLPAWLQGDTEKILAADEAFQLQVNLDPASNTVQANWRIADGYYLYRDKFRFALESPSVKLGAFTLPEGEIKSDPSFGEVEILRGNVAVALPVYFTAASPAESVELLCGYQGCKEGSICYPPIKKSIRLALDGLLPAAQAADTNVPPAARADGGSTGEAAGLLHGGGWAALLAFVGFGLLLAFTPCVFPMIPILSGVIVGQGERLTVSRSLSLTLAYVLAMALCYAILGVIAGALNINLQAQAQNPWLLAAFSLLLMLLALSMFGFYQLQLPAAWRERLTALSGRQQGGTLSGAAIMGMLSALIVAPCISPPMLAALLYINQSGDAVFGGAALFAMGLGFGLPLLLIGASAGSLLPRAGPWMDQVQRVFGVILLGMAIWFLGRILPGPIVLLLWGILAIGAAVFMGALDTLRPGSGWYRLWKGLGLVTLIYGAALVIGAAGGNHDWLRPLENYTTAQLPTAVVGGPPEFRQVSSVEELRREMQQAYQAQKPVMLDFYADWCIVCKELETYTFSDARVRQELEHIVLIQADVTDNAAPARELLQEFNLFGPPAVLFFGSDGQERSNYRVHEFLDTEQFLGVLRAALR